MTQFVNSSDGTRIAFDVTGQGPLLILLHGGSDHRGAWHQFGYVEQLKQHFRVAVVDLRGNGESDKPSTLDAYAIERLCEDVYAVADACESKTFSVWGYSFGGNIARYLAAESDRVEKAVIVGIPFGKAVDEKFREMTNNFVAEWKPILEAQKLGTLNKDELEAEDIEELENGIIEAWYYLLQAMLMWHDINPSDLRCATLAIVGTENEATYSQLKASEKDLQDAGGQLQVVEGLDHRQEFTQLDQIFSLGLMFLQQNM